ncbi:MAG: PH domain-containing protein [Candidatus Thermoplasmatota archaeon]
MRRKKDQEDDELLRNEIIERILSPHPLSFVQLQSVCLFLIVWGIIVGWLVNFSEYHDLLTSNQWFPVLVWGLVLLLIGIVVSLISVEWNVFFLYLAVFVGGVALMVSQGWTKDSAVFIPFYSVATSIIGFLIVELYRRSHKYIITNMRMIFKGGILTQQERTIRYDKIADINAKQGVLGRLCGFGTIIPISQSGFGLGSDKTLAATGAALGGKKAKLFGLFGGGRDVQVPRSRSYYELHGVYPYKQIKKLIESLVQKTVITPYQEEQVEFQRQQLDIQKQMRDLMKAQTKMKKARPAKVAHIKHEEDENEESEELHEDELPSELPPLEEDDIHKQMQAFLKKQKAVQNTKTRTDDIEDERPSDDDDTAFR